MAEAEPGPLSQRKSVGGSEEGCALEMPLQPDICGALLQKRVGKYDQGEMC